MSGDIFECCNWYWVEARDAGNTSTMDRIIPSPLQNKEPTIWSKMALMLRLKKPSLE